MSRSCLLVIDVGSSSARAGLYDTVGTALTESSAGTRRPYLWGASASGGMEYDADALARAVCEVIDGALVQARAEGREVAAVAVTTFWHSLMGVDGAGSAMTPVYGWGDSSAAADALQLRAEMDEAAMHQRTGCFLHPSYPSVKLVWLRRRDPELFGRVAGWVSFAEFLEQRLFGHRRCSVSMASGTGLLDVHRLEWDAAWLARAEIDEARLSPLVDTDAPASGLRPEFARRWPELATVPWYPALGDGACASVGSGAMEPGSLALTIGTSAALRAVWVADDVRIPSELWCYRLDARRWIVGQALSNGGSTVAYLKRTLRLPEKPVLEATLAAMEPDAHGLTVLPFLARERGPGWLREASASMVGLSHATPAEQVVRAVMEAVAYRIGIICARLEETVGTARAVYASGGALLSSPTWTQIVADTLGRSVLFPAAPEATSRGAALVALEQLGCIAELSAAPVLDAERFEADARRHAVYGAAMRRQAALHDALSPWLESVHDAPARPGSAH